MIYDLDLCAGKMQIEESGEGNGKKHVITIEGGQFGFSEVIKTEEGFQLVIYGEWEMEDMVYALNQHGHGRVRMNMMDDVAFTTPSWKQRFRSFLSLFRFRN